MSPSAKRQTPRAMALGGICLLGFGMTGCSRENGLDLTKQEARTDSAITERANESILRSKQELAGTKGGGKGATPAGLAQTEPDADEKPTLASRWKAPFKGAGNLLKKKPAEEVEDPFLAQAKPKNEKEATKVKESIAALQQEKALEAKAASAGEKKLAIADARTKPETPRAKSPMSTDSKAALDDFLKSQEAVGVEGRALAAGYEKEVITQKPGTTPGPKKTASETFSDKAVASAKPNDPTLEQRTLGNRSVASTGTARPFPVDLEPTDKPAARPTSKLRQNSQQDDRAKLAAADRRKSANPLLEEPAQPASRTTKTKQSTGREIAGLLKKAKTAGDRGQIEEAMSFAVAASDLAEQCSYEFAAGEQTPTIMLDWLSDKQAEAEQLSRGKSDRRQMLAARKQQKNVDALPTSFATSTAERIFAQEVEEPAGDDITTEAPAAAAVAARNSKSASESSFNEWAASVGRQATTKQRSPEWPVLSMGELAASDDLWQPSRSATEPVWPAARGIATDRHPVSERTAAASRETRLASAETDAPTFVATADAHATVAGPSAYAHDPIVQLGQPTDLAPDARDHLVARADGTASTRRGPRLAAPPPLSIEDRVDAGSASVRSKGMGRTAWFALIGGLVALVLFGFRRWAYRPTSEKS